MKIPVLLLAALVTTTGSVAAQQEIDETHRTSATGRVEVHNLAGTVRVTGWDRNEIRITGTLGRGAERLEVTPRGSATEIRVVIPRSSRNVRGSDLDIRVPAGKEVVVRTTSAEIEVHGITGTVAAHTTSGEVTVSGRPGEVTAVSTSGDVEVEVTSRRVQARSTSGDVRVSGSVRESVDVESTSGDVEVTASTPEVRAQSVSGDVLLRGVSGRVSASTVSGDAEISESRIQFLSFETVSGQLRFSGELQRGAAFNLQSHSGDVELALPANVSATFEVSSFSGDLDSAFGVQAQRINRRGPGSELRFTAGGGDALVTVRTFSGNVRLIRR